MTRQVTGILRKRKKRCDMSEAENDQADVNLKKVIGTVALRLSRGIKQSKGEKLGKLNSGIGLLNQAQLLVGVDDGKARRLVNQVRRFLNIKE